jgi:tetratricopeptide (TPR) repeat protein
VNPATRIRRWPIRLAAVVICLAILAAYHNSFLGPFVFDDEPAVFENPTIRQLWPTWETLSPPRDLTVSGRPLANFTLAINYALSGTRPWSYHAFNLLVHALAALTLFGVVRRTLACARCRQLLAGGESPGTAAPPPASKRRSSPAPASATRSGPDDSTLLALAITLLWALHPLQTEAVTYVVQRVESLMGLFFLLTLYCFIRSVEAPRPRPWQVCAIVACLLGAATKEVIALAPLLVLLYDRTFVAGSFAAAWRQRWRIHLELAFTWVALAGMIASTGWNRNGTSGFDIGVMPGAYWLTQFEAVARYLWLSFWPHPLVFEYGTFWVRRAVEALPFAVLVAPLAAATLVALWRWPVAGFLGAWFFGILAPTSIMPGRIQMIVEHRMYLPVAALVALAAVGVAARCGRPGIVALLAWAGALGFLTESRNAVYRDARSLWTDTVARRPGNDRAQNNLANALIDRGLLADGIAHYQTALRIRPDYPEAHSNLGNALLKVGRVAESIAECQAALKLVPKYAKAHNNLGNALLEAGRINEAISHYETSLQLRPGDAKTHYNLGNAWLRSNRVREAIAEYTIALRFEPNDAEARYNYGNGLLTADRVPEAIEQYLLALQLKPDYLDARTNLGNALLQLGRTQEAVVQFEAVLRARPNYPEGHNNLGAALFHAGRGLDAMREFQAALQLRPDYPDAQGNLERAQALAAGQAANPH